jgi:hypothetical protein
MTYKEHLEQLLSDSVAKSNRLIDIVRKEGMLETASFKKAQTEWEMSEKTYLSFLELVKAHQLNPDEKMTTC